jgi:glucan phosphoethanolaminetransferase (alkaline phosphatase superfamily)
MELDDLKRNWEDINKQQVASPVIKNTITRDRYNDPVFKLKQRFKKGLVVIPVIMAIALIEMRGAGIFILLLKWWMVLFTLTAVFYFYLNYRMMVRMQKMDTSVKNNLQEKLVFLKKGIKWRLLISRAFILAFIGILEVRSHVKPTGGLWDTPYRFLFYAGIFLLFYLVTKFAVAHRYGKHIDHLEAISQDLEERGS